MKRISKILGSIFIIGIIVIGFIYTSYNEQNYTRQGHLIHESGYTYLFYDNATDNVFVFESDDIIKDGTEVFVYMNTNNTTTIYDDIIKDYKIIP